MVRGRRGDIIYKVSGSGRRSQSWYGTREDKVGTVLDKGPRLYNRAGT